MRTICIAFLLGLLTQIADAASVQPKPDAVNLFNGRDLSGWISTGDADAWGVEDGEIVTKKPGRGGWLRTDRMYRDFELEIDFWMPEGGNSGVGHPEVQGQFEVAEHAVGAQPPALAGLERHDLAVLDAPRVAFAGGGPAGQVLAVEQVLPTVVGKGAESGDGERQCGDEGVSHGDLLDWALSRT